MGTEVELEKTEWREERKQEGREGKAYSVHDGVRLVGVFTLVALSVDRYVASYYDLGRCRTATVGRAVCAAIWLSFAVMTLPYWLYADTNTGGKVRRSCRVDWPDADPTTSGRYAPSKLTWIQVCIIYFVSLGKVCSRYYP